MVQVSGGPATVPGLADRTVLITGAGGLPYWGGGRAVARAFAGAGARVVAVDIAADSVQETVDLIGKDGGTATAVVADLSTSEGVEAAAAGAESAYGPVEVLVNHAGIGSYTSVTETTEQEWDRVLAVNLTAPFLLSKRILPSMVEAGRGVIVNTISIAGFHGARGGVSYTCSKHAMVGLTKHIAVAYRDSGIRCVGVAPGSIRSAAPDAPQPPGPPADGWLAGWGPSIQATNTHKGTPEEVARVHLFLASDAASYINGSVVTVDGGWTAV
ncbi:SDR family oxidoreductase [Amycolatopsis thermophila]|uniref:NAD(P)-dependent dehydrogenase (Short-subunit alcohol dehydrogenase family) n=1 Tax=Amycolatopsis thermophila TaxID=206084 RepID=A0ABU0F6N5_9PSEU|nr:SDR family oxidoreductase [Amycolatopsis thermophila]MDQ0382705.1 NAD(P)-dependent dehydrogenase (short-subunit alcohol dehydrogenase family) [Amycolatopsis thermophila]